jgi:hypothetical protein
MSFDEVQCCFWKRATVVVTQSRARFRNLQTDKITMLVNFNANIIHIKIQQKESVNFTITIHAQDKNSITYFDNLFVFLFPEFGYDNSQFHYTSFYVLSEAICFQKNKKIIFLFFLLGIILMVRG